MRCIACGTDNPVAAKFCVECGTSLSAACPSCGSAVVPGAKFCPECGTRLVAAAATGAGEASEPPTPDAATERRLVSVLFADLVGFTTLAEGRDSEAVRDLLARYFERASEVVGRYGGTVEKFIGDAVMAVWGTPVAHEDDAERAVRAALDLVDAVRALGEEEPFAGLQARAGVLTGEATVTLGARNQGMVAGDLVNTASRLQAVAEPGSVLVGDATRRAAEGGIVFERVGERGLKGKAAPVEAFRALRVVATVGGALRAEALEPPFVGRDTEFRLLRELLHATGRDRRARLVSLTGQAGIGKSRLAWEFHKYVDGIQETVWWHHGRSPSYGDGVTFWALGEMIRKRAGLAENDDAATSRARLTDAIAEHVADPVEQAFIEPALLTLLGLDEPPPGGRDRLFAGWRLFLERLSESATVVLVFEDLHWADDGMLDFVEHLLEWSRSYPILVVTLARPELLDRRATWGTGALSASLALGPLSEPAMRELLAGLVPGLPEPVVRSILGRADGIPLYAVETVRMLVADGRLEPDGEGRFRPAEKLGRLEIPATLQALIAARLDALDSGDRSLLQDASVLGKRFTVRALGAVSGIDTADLEPRLRALVARELLELDTDPASPERGQYGFVQALIREVAYGTLARRDRRSRHLAAARFFEAAGDDELAAVLASHYLDAYRAAPDGPEGEAIRVQARIALRAAADRALSLGSYGSALASLEEAVALGTDDPAEEAELLSRAGRAAHLQGRLEQAESLLARALARWREAGGSGRIGDAISDLALALLNGGKSDEALELLLAARDEFAGPEHELVRAPIASRLAHVYMRRGATGPAVEAAEEALPLVERYRMVELLIDTLITKAASLAAAGRDLEGIVLLEGALRMAREAGSLELESRAMVNAVVLQLEEDPRRAFELSREAREQGRRFGLLSNFVNASMNQTELAIRLGEWAAADEAIASVRALELERFDRVVVLAAQAMLEIYRDGGEECLRELEALGEIDLELDGFRNEVLAVAAQLHGDYATARRLTLEAASRDTLNAPSYYERAGRAALWLGDVVGMRADLAAFEAISRTATFPDTQRAAIAAGLLALEGRRQEAVDAYRDLFRRYRELGLVFDAALVHLDAARALGVETPDGSAALAEARSVFEALGAERLLAVSEALRGATGGPASLVRQRTTEAMPA